MHFTDLENTNTVVERPDNPDLERDSNCTTDQAITTEATQDPVLPSLNGHQQVQDHQLRGMSPLAYPLLLINRISQLIIISLNGGFQVVEIVLLSPIGLSNFHGCIMSRKQTPYCVLFALSKIPKAT